MARKDPKDLTVEEKLKALFQLQTTLSQIDEKRLNPTVGMKASVLRVPDGIRASCDGVNSRLSKI